MQESKKASRYSNRTGSSLFFKEKRLSQIWRAPFEGRSTGRFREKGQLLFVLQRYLFGATNHLCPEMHVICCMQVKRYEVSR